MKRKKAKSAAVPQVTGFPKKMADAVRADGWENCVTGLGTYERDKSQHQSYKRPLTLSQDWITLSSLYHTDDISGRAIDAIPDHMFRRGWEQKVKDDVKGTKTKTLLQESTRLGVAAKLKEGITWGRLYGGAALILGIVDGRTMDQPVNEDAITDIAYINVVDRRFIIADRYYGDPLKPKHGEPMLYRIYNMVIDPLTTPSDSNMTLVHESRIIRFEGATTDKIERRQLGGWTHSVLQRPHEKIKAFVSAFQAAGNLLTDASQGVYKVNGLFGMIAGGEQDALLQRLLQIDMARSTARAIVIDSEGEDFERTVASLAGYPDMLDRVMMLLSAALEIPVTILMGRSAAGMNATGDSDFRQFYSKISSAQVNELEPILQRLFKMIARAKLGAGGVDISFTFRSLWEPTAKEQAETNYIQAQADNLYVTMGSATPEEIALSRFQDGGQLNLTTVIDLDARREAQEGGTSFDPYENDPEPDPLDPNAPPAPPGKANAPAAKTPTGKPAAKAPAKKAK